MITDSLAGAVDRVVEILKAADGLKGATFRFGSLASDEVHSASPTIYVTPADRAEVSRETFAGRGGSEAVPAQKIVRELWVRAFADGPTPEKVQRLIEDLTASCVEALSGNVRLRRPADGSDPLCATSRAYVQGALTRWRGTVLEGRTIRLRITQVQAYAPTVVKR